MLNDVNEDEFDLIVIGAGSGNSLIGPEFDAWRVAIVERWTFGGTCLNRGCIPSKMLIYPADRAHAASDSSRYGLATSFDWADWPAIVGRIFGRIDPIAASGREYRHSAANPNVTVFEADARFVGEHRLDVGGGRVITGRQIVLAAGARTFVPPIPGLDGVPFHTSDTILRIGQLPTHLVILGGGFVAAELGHVFRSFGSAVTIINRGRQLLTAEDHDVSAAFTAAAADRFSLRLGAAVRSVEKTAEGIAVHITDAGGDARIEGDVVLVALGRRPNGDQLDGAAAGVDVDASGAVTVDRFGRTSAAGVWALGDINGRHQLKHMANGEARVIRHNLLHPDNLLPLDDRPAPHAVFTHPQIGAIGPTEQALRASGKEIVVVKQAYGDAAYGWALEDTTGFIKLIGDPSTRRLLAAHVFGHEASILVQLLVQGIHLGSTVDEMATGQVWIHPALSEVVEQALLSLIDGFDTFHGASQSAG
jgi:mycothione reductase